MNSVALEHTKEYKVVTDVDVGIGFEIFVDVDIDVNIDKDHVCADNIFSDKT